MIDFEELARKRKKEEDDRLDSIARWQVQDRYKMSILAGGIDTRAETELLKMQDYNTQQKIQDLNLRATFAKTAGDINTEKYLKFKAEELLLSTPKKKDNNFL